MMIRTTTIAVSMLILATIANADDRYQRRDDRSASGRIAWSTRDRSGNTFGISFDFSGRNVGFNVNYQQNRYGRNDRYYQYNSYAQRGRNYTPPNYDYLRYGRGDYDRLNFGSYQEWNDWRYWQSQWDHHHGWSHNDRERQRAWKAFQHEREHAYRQYDNRRNQNSRNDRGRNRGGDRRRSGRRG